MATSSIIYAKGDDGTYKVVASDDDGQLKIVATGGSGGGLTDAELRATPVPVSGPVTDAQIRATALPVSAASLPLPANAAQDGTDGASPPSIPGTGIRGWLRSIYDKLSGSLAVTGTFWQATQPVSGPLTDTQLRATAVPVSGTVTASGPLTDTQLRASAVPVSGTFWQGTQPVSIASMPSTPVTGTFWQATQPVSGTFWQATQPVSAVSLPLPSGAATEAKQDTGNTSLGNIDSDLDALKTAQGAASASVVGPLVQGVVSDSPPTLTTDTVQPLSLNSEGRLRVLTEPANPGGPWEMIFESFMDSDGEAVKNMENAIYGW